LTSRGCEPQESSQPDRQTNVKEGDPDTPSIGLFAGDSTTALVCASGGEVYRDRRAVLWGEKKKKEKEKKEEEESCDDATPTETAVISRNAEEAASFVDHRRVSRLIITTIVLPDG